MSSSIPAVVSSAIASATSAAIASATSAAHAEVTSAHVTNSAAIHSIETAAIASGTSAAKASASAVIAAFKACPPQATEPSKAILPHTNLTLHRLFTHVGLLFMILCLVGCVANFVSHLLWRTNFKEQRHLMRLTVLPLFFAVFAWCSIDFYGIETFLSPISKIYEVYCVITFFEFMIQVLAPNEEERVQFFVSADRMDRRGKNRIHEKGSYRWYRVQRMIVYLAFSVNLFMTILGEILAGVLCRTAMTYRIWGIVSEVITFVFTILALMVLVRVYRRFRKDYQGTHLLRRFWTFKGLVWLIIHQQLILEIIVATKTVKSTKYMSQGDWLVGVPQFMTCAEAFIFAFVYMSTLSGLGYRGHMYAKMAETRTPHKAVDGSVGKYVFSFVFPMDIFVGFWESLKTLCLVIRGRDQFDYTGGTGASWKEWQSRSEDEASQEPLHRIPVPNMAYDTSYGGGLHGGNGSEGVA